MAALYPVLVNDGDTRVLAVCSQLDNARMLRDKVNKLFPSAEGDVAWVGDAVLFNPSHAAALETLASWGWDPAAFTG